MGQHRPHPPLRRERRHVLRPAAAFGRSAAVDLVGEPRRRHGADGAGRGRGRHEPDRLERGGLDTTRRGGRVAASRRGGAQPAAAPDAGTPRRPLVTPAAFGAQSLKFLNCRGMPKSSALRAVITACRSSRFLLWTRTWSPWACEDTPLTLRSLMNLFSSRAFTSLIPTLSLTVWRTVPLAASSTSP